MPYDQLDRLIRLKELIEEKLPPPQGGENSSSLLHLPIMDSKNSKSQVAAYAHIAFMQELVTFGKDMERFVLQAKHGRIKKENLTNRLVEYQEMKAKTELYWELLGMPQEEILKSLTELEEKARTLIQTATFVNQKQLKKSNVE